MIITYLKALAMRVLTSGGGKKPYYERVLSILGKSFGFTLSEVLIVLGVIGVIIAITISTLITRVNEVVTIKKVKKFHSMMNQGLRLTIEELGDVDTWNLPKSGKERATAFAKNLGNNIRFAVDYGSGPTQKKYTHTYNYLGNKNKWSTYKTSKDYYVLKLDDGGLVIIKVQSNNCSYSNSEPDINGDVCGLIFYDINAEKMPNTFGKDFFVFLIKKDTIMPRDISMGCSIKSGQGQGCSHNIIYNGDMSYLH
jgi:prepilin-type N-terminal cleavage/methylation domain-containing protein